MDQASDWLVVPGPSSSSVGAGYWVGVSASVLCWRGCLVKLAAVSGLPIGLGAAAIADLADHSYRGV
jgi:hypothetical protein